MEVGRHGNALPFLSGGSQVVVPFRTRAPKTRRDIDECEIFMMQNDTEKQASAHGGGPAAIFT